ncbi:MAG: hypothetical protein AAGC55_04940, partial [Myxococcota bacterium]
MTFRLAARTAAFLLLWSLALSACQSCDKKEETPAEPPAPPTLAGLQAMPGQVTVLVGAEVTRLRDSWLVERAVKQMFRRDPELEQRIDQLIAACKFDPAEQLDSVLIGLGRDSDTSAGAADQAVMVLTGVFDEGQLASCINQSVTGDGGTFSADRSGTRTYYHTRSGDGPGAERWFTLTGPRTLVVATSRTWLQKAVEDGEKVASSTKLAPLLGQVDQSAGLWAVGLVDQELGR